MEQRLTAAAEEILELFGRTVAEFEEELCRQRKTLEEVLKPEVVFHRAGGFCSHGSCSVVNVTGVFVV